MRGAKATKGLPAGGSIAPAREPAEILMEAALQRPHFLQEKGEEAAPTEMMVPEQC